MDPFLQSEHHVLFFSFSHSMNREVTLEVFAELDCRRSLCLMCDWQPTCGEPLYAGLSSLLGGNALLSARGSLIAVWFHSISCLPAYKEWESGWGRGSCH